MSDPEPTADRRVIVTALGLTQIMAWGSSYYLPAVIAPAVSADTGWPFAWVIGSLSLGLLVAGLVSPRVGAAIERHGGRITLAFSAVCLGAGQLVLAASPTLAVFVAGWLIIGLGMGAGLYDAAFGTLGRLYGRGARSTITSLTLFGGFASTICWPLSAFMIDHAGWRIACLIYAAMHLVIALPLQMAVVKKSVPVAAPAAQDVPPPIMPARIENETTIFALLAVMLSISAGIGSIVIVNFMIFLQARGVDYAVAVSLGTLFGPAQVGARVIERLFGNRYHPIWTMVASCGLMAFALIMLLGSFPLLLLIILIYGAGYGISWIGRGTLPLALFGPERFPRLMGKLAFPSLIVQAAAPSAGAWLIETSGAHVTIAVLTGLALINVVLIGLLWASCRARISMDA
jgi:hypothetical protein